jgi:hypothetical protein
VLAKIKEREGKAASTRKPKALAQRDYDRR